MAKLKTYLIMTGSIVSGFDWIGPFATYEEAADYALANDYGAWEVVDCIAPGQENE